jgi:hypothetical protein
MLSYRRFDLLDRAGDGQIDIEEYEYVLSGNFVLFLFMGTIVQLLKKNLKSFLFIIIFTLFVTVSSAAPQIPLCRRMLGSKPRLLRLWIWQSEAFTTPLVLIHKLGYISSTILLDFIHTLG